MQQPHHFLKKKKHSDSIQNAQLPLYTTFGRNWYKTFEVIPLAANDNIVQHFAATWWFLQRTPVRINSECLTTPVYQVWKWSMHNYPNHANCCLFGPYIWKNCCCSSSSSNSKKNFDSIKMFLISNEEKSISFKKKI